MTHFWGKKTGVLTHFWGDDDTLLGYLGVGVTQFWGEKIAKG